MSKKCRFIVYSMVCLCTLFVLYVLSRCMYQYGVFMPYFKLLQEETITLSLDEEYKEYGYEAYYHFKNYQQEVEVSGRVNTS